MPIAVYLPPLYGESLGLSLATVGLVFTLARIWDVVTDPIMGVVIDRYGSRWGQYKHWIALAIPILMLSVYMVFLPGEEKGECSLSWRMATRVVCGLYDSKHCPSVLGGAACQWL
jgi:Na+/melibiose symporter-like transporter